MSDSVVIEAVDMRDRAIQHSVIELIDQYARDPNGGGTPLSDQVRGCLGDRLAEFEGHLVLLATLGGNAVGVAICFEGFSTFYAKRLLNIHDLAVLPEHRGRGIGRKLLQHLESIAVERDYCKLTLEVLVDNDVARSLYRSFGFLESPFANKQLMFLSKTLDGKSEPPS